MANIDQLYRPLDVGPFRETAEAQRLGQSNERLIKVGIAVCVLDEKGRMLFLEHEARDGEWDQGALGPSMETFRYAEPDRISDTTETPMQTWQRSLLEELKINADDLTDANLFYGSGANLIENKWPIRKRGILSPYYHAYNLIVKTENPELFLDRPVTEEVVGTRYMNPAEIADYRGPKRPGLNEWMKSILPFLANVSFDSVIRIEPVDLPKKTGPDVRFD